MLAPAGDVNVSLPDYLKFIALHLKGLRGTPGIVSAGLIQQMHVPNGDYAYGWAAIEVNGVPTSEHEGTAGTFYAVTLIQPSTDQAVVGFTNSADREAEMALVEAVGLLLGLTPTRPGELLGLPNVVR